MSRDEGETAGASAGAGSGADAGDDLLQRARLPEDPLDLFRAWQSEARGCGLHEPDAMTLATADAAGRPSARTVLLRGLDPRGLCWFTNHDSRKGRELAANPRAALLFHWDALRRQVRVEGPVERVADTESDAYFERRARGSQIGAWASPQSEAVSDRAALDELWRATEARFEGRPVPRPPFWGGWRLVPEHWEFWASRRHRLHDRLVYERTQGAWRVLRLAP